MYMCHPAPKRRFLVHNHTHKRFLFLNLFVQGKVHLVLTIAHNFWSYKFSTAICSIKFLVNQYVPNQDFSLFEEKNTEIWAK